MKMQYIIIFIIFVTTIFGCYEDKGNYSYKDINQISIEKTKTQYLGVGDTLEIKPVLTFSQSEEEATELSYTWTFAGKIRSTSRDLFWIADTATDGNMVLEITDAKTDMVYMQSTSCLISGKYEAQGWIVLSEKDGNSSLSFLRETNNWNDEAGKYTYSYVPYPDIYYTENHEILGQHPRKIHVHFSNEAISSFMVVQGSSPKMIDISGVTLKKDITIDEAFLDHTLPVNFDPMNTMSMAYVDLIENRDGKIFSRLKTSKELFHSSYYLPEPLALNGEELNCSLILSIFSTPGFALMHDKAHNRLLSVMDKTSNVETPLLVQEVPGLPTDKGEVVPENFVPLNNMGDNKLLYIGYSRSNYSYGAIEFFALMQDANGNYFNQIFDVDRDYFGTTLMIANCQRNEMPELTGIYNENSVVYNFPYQTSSYVLISSGNKIYLYNRTSPEGLLLYYTFDGDVTAMDAESYNSFRMGVGLANGKFYVLDMKNAKNLPDSEKLIYPIAPEESRLGEKIVDVRYRVESGNDWW